MKRFIFEERNGIHILDLEKTIMQLHRAGRALRDIVLQGGSVLFVGTKKQAKEVIYRTATRCGMFYMNERWLGGTLTNIVTIRKSIARLKELEAMSADGTFEKLPKKEVAHLLHEKAKLHKYLDGIKEMDDLPGSLFVVDTRRENIAITEARKIGIPVVAMVDSTSDPDLVDYPIAANDDAIKSITLISNIIADHIVEAQNELYKSEPEAAPPAKEEPSSPEQVQPPAPVRPRRGVAKPGTAEAAEGGARVQPHKEGESKQEQVGPVTEPSVRGETASPSSPGRRLQARPSTARHGGKSETASGSVADRDLPAGADRETDRANTDEKGI